MSATETGFDVVIAGGGLVGGSLAVALAALPLRIAVVEAVPADSAEQPSFDDRTIALSRGSQQILSTIGLWPAVADEAVPIRAIHVSERGRFGTALLTAAEQGVEALGAVVASRAIGRALWARLASLPNVTVFCPARAADPQPGPDRISVTLDGTRRIDARLLVVAEGARSALRAALGVGVAERDYGQTAIVGNVAIAGQASGDKAWERFTREGPLALLPYRDGRFVFVLARASDAAAATMALDDAAFLALLQESFGLRLGRFESLGRRTAYPLTLVEAARTTAPRAAIIGNAAHGLHPVAGQGFNLGLRDVAALAEVVADALRRDGDPGAVQVLDAYADWRARDQRNVVAFTDGLIRLFDLPLASVGVARGAGLALFDILPGARRALARETMGLGGRMSRLARGLPL